VTSALLAPAGYPARARREDPRDQSAGVLVGTPFLGLAMVNSAGRSGHPVRIVPVAAPYRLGTDTRRRGSVNSRGVDCRRGDIISASRLPPPVFAAACPGRAARARVRLAGPFPTRARCPSYHPGDHRPPPGAPRGAHGPLLARPQPSSPRRCLARTRTPNPRAPPLAPRDPHRARRRARRPAARPPGPLDARKTPGTTANPDHSARPCPLSPSSWCRSPAPWGRASRAVRRRCEAPSAAARCEIQRPGRPPDPVNDPAAYDQDGFDQDRRHRPGQLGHPDPARATRYTRHRARSERG